MTKKENFEATTNGEENVKKESKIKTAFGKVTHFVAANRGKIALAFGLIAGAAGGVVVTNALADRDCKDEFVEVDCTVLNSEESSEVI